MPVCEACTFAHDHGHWGDTLPKGAGTHCRVWHVSWPGSQKWGHCSKCHQTFASVSAFDRHKMVTNCTEIGGKNSPVSDIGAAVCDALSEHAAAQKANVEVGKRRFLVQREHPTLGWWYWGWNSEDQK